MPQTRVSTMMLRDFLKDASGRTLSDPRWVIAMSDIRNGTILSGRAGELAGCSVLVAMADQLTTSLAMFELDGVARRMLLCPPDLRTEHLASVIADAAIDAVVCDQPALWSEFNVPLCVGGGLPLRAAAPVLASHETEWLLLTSGTTGAPKVVSHSLEGLTGAITAEGPAKGPPPVWATFYDMRRYGGLQIFLRAVIGGGSMVLSDPKESIGEHLARLIKMGVTHISGTPSHWRKALMTSGIA